MNAIDQEGVELIRKLLIEEKDRGDEQFEISDGRDVKQVYDDLVKIGLQPVMSDYIYCG